jgi:hypothetical protein
MKKIWMVGWLLVPVIFLAVHYGPGQAANRRDELGSWVRQAEAAVAAEQWDEAVDAYQKAIDQTDAETELSDRQHLHYAQAKAMIQAGQMIQGQNQLTELLEDLATEEPNSSFARQTRNELATSQYHAAWLMRREGATEQEWMIEAEAARQNFRLLAERADAEDVDESKQFKENLESTIRLEQMSAEEFLALPLPKKCSGNCKNLSQRKRKQRKSSNGKGKGKGKGKKKEKKKDARQQIQRQKGAGDYQRPEGGS